MKRALVVVFSILGLVSCATGPSKPQDLVDRAVDAMGGADKLAGIKTVWAKGSTKQWEPEQSEVPGGEMRFANEASYQVWQDRSQRAARYDWEKNFAYPAASYQGFIVAFDAQTGLPARVRTLDYDNVWGDVDYDTVYSDWRDSSGIKIPMHRKTELNGRVIAETTLNEIRINPAMQASYFEVPAAIRAGAAKPATGNVPYQWVIRRQYIGTYLDSESIMYDARAASGLRLQELAPGVQHVVGGTHNALLVEMSDHLIAFDAPVTDLQSKWIIDAAKAKYPGKPIRYLVLTHHHMDHSGGLRAY